jgi:hypothetical protein
VRFNTSSGEEGIYPDLTRHAEEHLAKIKPLSVVLRKAEPALRRNMLNARQRQEIDDDISSWTCEMQSREKDLNEGKANLISGLHSQPGIRQIKLDATKVYRRDDLLLKRYHYVSASQLPISAVFCRRDACLRINSPFLIAIGIQGLS